VAAAAAAATGRADRRGRRRLEIEKLRHSWLGRREQINSIDIVQLRLKRYVGLYRFVAPI
jgi:hypothetical protein